MINIPDPRSKIIKARCPQLLEACCIKHKTGANIVRERDREMGHLAKGTQKHQGGAVVGASPQLDLYKEHASGGLRVQPHKAANMRQIREQLYSRLEEVE
jgi:hypothetical protein